MKKILALLLVAIMCFAVVSCKKDDIPGKNSTSSSSSSSSSSSTTTTAPVTPSQDPTKDFEDVNETVYTTEELNIRTSAQINNDNIYKTAKAGESFVRIGKNDTWSKLLIDGKEYYAKSAYLTTEKPLEFTEVSKTMYINKLYIKSSAYIFKAPKDDTNTVTTWGLDTPIKVTGIAKETVKSVDGTSDILWCRVEVTVDDKTVTGYINSKNLSETPDPTFDELDFVPCEDTILVVDGVNIRTYPILADSTKHSFIEAGTELPRVGIAQKADENGITWSIVVYEGNCYYISSNSKYVRVVSDSDVFTTDYAVNDEYTISLSKFFWTSSESIENVLATYYSNWATVSVSNSGSMGANVLSPKEFAEAMIKLMGVDGATVTENNGLTYFEIVSGDKDMSFYSLIVVTKGLNNDVYTTTFTCLADDANDLVSDFIEYAKSIKIEKAKAN